MHGIVYQKEGKFFFISVFHSDKFKYSFDGDWAICTMDIN